MVSRRLACQAVVAATLGAILGLPASAANILLNPGFEEGYETYWTRNAGELNGQGLGEEPHSGTKSWHGAWNFAGSNQTTTYYQDVPVQAGATVNASMWCKGAAFGGTHGNDTHSFRLRIRFRNNAGTNMLTVDGTSNPDDTYQQIVLAPTVAPAETTHVRVLFSYITTQPANAWKVWNIDDLVLDSGTGADQQIVFGITPGLIPNNLNNTAATITGERLTGVTAVKLVQGATVLNGAGINVAPDGKSLTVTFPTTGAPFGDYDVVVEKTSYAPAYKLNAFRIRDPSANYLVNGGFEAGPGAGGAIPSWNKWWSNWGGNPAMERIAVESTEWIHCPKTGGVNDPSPEGDYSFRCGEYNENGGEAGIYQHVPVTPGETLLLSWKWGGGSQIDFSGNPVPSQTACELGVLKGTYTNMQFYNAADLLGMARRQNADFYSFGWLDDAVSFTVPAGVTTVTVYTKVWNGTPGAWQAIAMYTDAMVLSAPSCPNQHTVTGINPTAVQNPIQPFDLTVTGVNLNTVSAIRIARGNDQYFGTIQPGATSGQLVASFTPPEGGFVLGNYDVVTTQDGCFGQILSQALTIACGDSIVLSSVAPNVLVKPQGVVQLTVSGQNVASLSEVKLVHVPPARPKGDPRPPYWVPVSEVTGTVIDDSNPDAVVMEFDFYNASYKFHDNQDPYTGSAQAGSYKLVGDTGTVCPDPAELADAFELQLPTGENVVENPGFETGEITPWELIPSGENTDKPGVPQPGPQLVYAPVGSPWYGFNPAEGSYLVGNVAVNDGTWENWLTPNKGTLRQSLGLPNGSGQYAVTLTYWVRMFDNRPGGPKLTASIIADRGLGTEQVSSVVAQMVDLPKMSDDGFDPYTQLSVDFLGTVTTSLEIEFNFESYAEGAGWGENSVIAVDDVALIGVTACGTPPFDMDGDLDVDQEDFGLFQACYIGNFPGSGIMGACRCVDSDGDDDVDQSDYSDFVNCALTSGPDIPANCP